MNTAICKLYDINCKQQCGLQAGISRRFEANLREQQDNKLSKTNITSQIFDDPEKQRKFQSITNDTLFTILNEPSDQEILRKGSKNTINQSRNRVVASSSSQFSLHKVTHHCGIWLGIQFKYGTYFSLPLRGVLGRGRDHLLTSTVHQEWAS